MNKEKIDEVCKILDQFENCLKNLPDYEDHMQSIDEKMEAIDKKLNVILERLER